ERQTLRTAAFGAIFLVSNAEPGILDMFKETFAASKSFATSPQLRDLLQTGGRPQMPKGSATEVESSVLDALRQSTSILETKGQPELDSFRSAISSAVDQVAGAAGGVSTAETDAIDKVKAAMATSA